ncbi:MAG: hypothetical protein R3D69_18340 [Xanthobacteraceae bacterium]
MKVLEVEAVAVAGGDVVAARRLLDLERARAPVSQLPHAGRAGAGMRQVEHLDLPQRPVGGAARAPRGVAGAFFAGDGFGLVHGAAPEVFGTESGRPHLPSFRGASKARIPER